MSVQGLLDTTIRPLTPDLTVTDACRMMREKHEHRIDDLAEELDSVTQHLAVDGTGGGQQVDMGIWV